MDNNTKNQEGSPTRDKFKRMHKELNKGFYACDIDFVFVEKEPFPDIVLALDYKAMGDTITFSETIAYASLDRRGIPVYIVTGNAEAGVFKIQKFVGGHYRKPRVELQDIAVVKSWEEFGLWEKGMRMKYKNRWRI